MKLCIICRETKEITQFNDEHVIPDSIGGYYHIRSVCTECNSKLGARVDNKLTNHKFIEFQRFISNIKGKSGAVPNPFSGTHVLKDDPEQKVILKVEKDGTFKPHLVTRVIVDDAIPSQFSVVVDKENEVEVEKIQAKFLRRLGVTKEQITTEKIESSDNPMIKTTLKIDIIGFKLGMLKIAYEFTADMLPNYLDDPASIDISNLLLNANADELNQKLTMLGNGFQQELMKPFEWFLDLSTENHYLILYDIPGTGLYCFVRLFNSLSIAFLMSPQSGYIANNFIIGKNDIRGKTFQVKNVEEIMRELYLGGEYAFRFWFPDQAALNEYRIEEKHPGFAYFMENGKQPVFNAQGKLMYADISEKLAQPQLPHKSVGDKINNLDTEYELDEELFIRVLPSNKLYQIVTVVEKIKRSGKF